MANSESQFQLSMRSAVGSVITHRNAPASETSLKWNGGRYGDSSSIVITFTTRR